MLATFLVVNTNDTGVGSLRDAILQANATAGADTIAFAIPGAGAKTIAPLSALPSITDSVTIDANTQGASATPLIEIDGSGAGAAASGVRLTGGASTLRGLAINGFKLNGVLLASNGNVIEDCFVGLSTNGSAAAPNLLDGIQITGSNNIVGGSTGSATNFISGNGRNGVSILGSAATTNSVKGNVIGLDFIKTNKVPNAQAGVRISAGAKSNVVGGLAAAERNFISGNTAFGVLIENAGTDLNVVKGNFIGNGTLANINGANGVGVTIRGGAKQNKIGTSETNGGNTIAGNTGSGVQIRGAGTTDNQIASNLIGTLSVGSVKFANGEDGILVDTGAANNTIGGATSADGNFISGNIRSGIFISGSGTNSNRVWSNTIGLNIAGTTALANEQAGITIRSGAANNEIGSRTAGNIISGNQTAGVRLQGSGTTGNTLIGNVIGLNTAKTASVPNTLDGVVIEQAAAGNIIGGVTLADFNLISGNARAGVRISGSGTTNNTVRANKIGTLADTAIAVGNAIGVWITSGAKANQIGDANARNIISGNFTFGVSLSGVGTENNAVIANFIGTTENGLAARGNLDGIYVSAGAKNNTIGGTSTTLRNVISGNRRDGVSLTGSNTTGNSILGNFIGLSTSGNSTLSNTRHGISIRSGASATIGSTLTPGSRNYISGNGGNGMFIGDAGSSAVVVHNTIGLTLSEFTSSGNTGNGIELTNGATASIGGLNTDQGNIISGNIGHGILITGAATSGVSIQGNLIGTDSTGTLSRANQDDGIHIDQGANNVTIGAPGPIRNVISGNKADGIHVQASHDVTIKNTLIGTAGSGQAAVANSNGVRLENSTHVLLGGPNTADRNVVGGNTFDGILVVSGSLEPRDTNVRVEGNFIGLGSDGVTLVPNKDGIQVASTGENLTIANNFISGNGRTGIRTANTSNLSIVGNKIGVLGDGVTAGGNVSHGIILHTNSHDIRIGGDLQSEANLIAHNGGDGVLIGSDPTLGFNNEAGVGNSVLGNLIFSNSGLAVDLGPNNGATPNDANDFDIGPNNLQNAPVLNLATSVDGSVFLRGILDGTAGNYRIDFFAGSAAGQAQQYLGSLFDAITNSTDLEMALILEANVAPGSFVMAVATNLTTGDSSELSVSLLVL